jgi:hypothetical protein
MYRWHLYRGGDRMKMAPQDTAMEPRPTPRWPRGTCFAWELLRGCRKGPMLEAAGLCCVLRSRGPASPMVRGRYGVAGQPALTQELIATQYRRHARDRLSQSPRRGNNSLQKKQTDQCQDDRCQQDGRVLNHQTNRIALVSIEHLKGLHHGAPP